MEITRTREHSSCSCVLVQLQVQLTVFIFWIALAHPSSALYLDFRSNHQLDQDSANVPRDELGHETLSWAVKIQHQTHRKNVNRTHVDLLADVIAEDLRLKNYGQVGELMGHYLFAAESYHEALNGSMEQDLVGKIRGKAERALARHPMIEWFNQQTIRRRFKRSLIFTDPSYPNQWHLVSIRFKRLIPVHYNHNFIRISSNLPCVFFQVSELFVKLNKIKKHFGLLDSKNRAF